MSFLAGRLAATEGAFFLQESKHAAGRLAQKLPPSPAGAAAASASPAGADVLPEILRHSLPIQGSAAPPEATSSLSTASKWLLQGPAASSSTVSSDALNRLRAYVSLPQATFGPKRWQVPNEYPSFSASTANDLRRDRSPYPPVDPEKLKAVVAGYSQIGKAFAFATVIVFGGATALFLHIAHKLQLQTIDDIKTKGRELLQPGADIVKEQIGPLRTWADKMSRKMHIEADGEAKERPVFKELSKRFSARTPN